MSGLTVKRIANGRTIRLVAFASALLAVSLAVCWNFQQQIYSRLAGAAGATADELAAIPSLDSSYRRLFEMNAPGATRLGFRYERVNTRRGRETGRTYQYFFAVPGKRNLLLRANVDSLAFPATGEIKEIPGDIRAKIQQIHPQLLAGGGIAPLMLDVEDPAYSFDSMLALVAALVPVALLGWLLLGLLRLMDFRRVPGVAALKRFGEPIDQVIARIDTDLQAGEPKTAIGSLLVTPSWLLHKKRTKLDLVRLEDLIWIYSSVTTKKIYGFIPYSWSYALHLGDRHGKMLAVKGSKNKVPEAATAILQRIPWVIPGYSDEIAQAFRGSRPMLIEAVEKRRQEFLGQTQQPPAAT